MERQSEKIENDLDKFEFGINKCKLEDFLSYGTINELSHFLAKQGYTKQEWISVEDRLPNKYESVLVLSNAGYISIDGLCGENIWLEHRIIKVTHWMPLPQKPKMKGAE